MHFDFERDWDTAAHDEETRFQIRTINATLSSATKNCWFKISRILGK